MKDVRNLLSAFAWLTGLLIAVLALHTLGQGTYALPDISRHGFGTWFSETEITVVVLSIVRVAAMGAILYLFATTITCAVFQRLPWKRATKFAIAITFPGGRILAGRLAGISAIGTLAMPIATAQAATQIEVPVLHHLLPNEASPSFQPNATTSSTTSSTTSTSVFTIPEPKTTAVNTPAPLATTPSAQQHTVKRGENFWTIAQDALATSLQREPTEKEIITYWRQLVKTNQQSLADSKNPDLLFAGQVIELPALQQTVQ